MLQENKQPSEAPGSPASTSNDMDELADGAQYPPLQNYSVLHGLVGPACIFLRQSIAITQMVCTALLSMQYAAHESTAASTAAH
uniref:Uncharacterized protein n=1 Tax=Varanus komodoensis TaxID=61221 RepID=A0A8D2KRV8_VARKO